MDMMASMTLLILGFFLSFDLLFLGLQSLLQAITHLLN